MTAYNQNDAGISLSASGDAQSWIYHFVKLSGGRENFDLANGASGPAPVGILQDDPVSGGAGRVVFAGRAKVYADASGSDIGIGDWVCSGSDGQAVLATGSAVQGQALMAVSSTASVLMDILVCPFQTVRVDNTP